MNAMPEYIAPTVAAEDAQASARYVPMDPRVSELQRTNAELRTRIEAADQRIADQERTMSGMARLIGEQREELRTLKGENARPQGGCHFATAYCGDASILIEFDYTPAEEGSNDIESPRFGPSYPEEVEPLRAFINGHWVDLSDIDEAFSGPRLEEACMEAISEARENAAAARYEAMEP